MLDSVRSSISRLLNRISPHAFVPLRVFAGIAFMTHGWPKVFDAERFARFSGGVADMGFPAPAFFAWAAALSELIGGLLIAVGLLTRPAAFFGIITMVVAVFIRHASDPFGRKELGLMFMFTFIGFLVAGGGKLSVDGLIRRWREKRRAARNGPPASGGPPGAATRPPASPPDPAHQAAP